MRTWWALLALAGCAVDASGLPRPPHDLGTPMADQGLHDVATPVDRGATLTAGSSLYANDAPSVDVSAGFSLDLWANLDVLPAGGRMGLADKNGQFGVFVYPGGRVTCTASGVAAEYTGVSAETWFHVACTHDGSTLRLVDGRERGTATGPPPGFGTAALNLGEDSPSGGDQLGGRLDEVRLWTRALPPSMVESAAARR